jgi:stage II sporulation protein D
MRRLLPLLTLLLALLVPCAAHAATAYVVRGAGFGHGIGMSQYGAYGFAQKGFGFAQILDHYYHGTQLAPAPSRPVRVLMQASRSRAQFRGATRASGGKELDPTVTYSVTRVSGDRLALSGDGKPVGSFDAPLRVNRPGQPLRLIGRALNGVSNGLYRGSLELQPGAAGGVTAINSLPMDAYVQGVVAGEMPSGWALAALRAQAVTARTYALATRKPSGPFDQYPDTRSQVYRGVRGETARSNQAVRDTAGRILTYAGKPAVTYYFSTSGGRTENVELSFLNSEPKPWLESVEDPYDGISPKHRWRVRFSSGQLGSRLGAPGRFRKVRVIKRGRSPRIVRARVYGSRGTRVLTGAQIRSRLDLYDSWVYFTRVTSSQVRRPGALAATVALPQLGGVMDPAPRTRKLLLERRRTGRWAPVRELRTTRRGRFRSAVGVAGLYRVRAGAVAGPAVRIGR